MFLGFHAPAFLEFYNNYEDGKETHLHDNISSMETANVIDNVISLSTPLTVVDKITEVYLQLAKIQHVDRPKIARVIYRQLQKNNVSESVLTNIIMKLNESAEGISVLDLYKDKRFCDKISQDLGIQTDIYDVTAEVEDILKDIWKTK